MRVIVVGDDLGRVDADGPLAGGNIASPSHQPNCQPRPGPPPHDQRAGSQTAGCSATTRTH